MEFISEENNASKDNKVFLTDKTKKIHTAISLAMLLMLVLILTKDIWFGSGYIIFSDLDFGNDDKTYISRMLGIFNDKFSSMNFFNLSRLAFIVPFYLISFVFSNFSHAFLLKSIIVGVFTISALGMYFLCRKIILAHFGEFSSKYHYYGLIIPSIFYAINPWVMFRIQHIFLLAGYACYPWILNYFLDLFKERLIEDKNKCILLKVPIIKRKFIIREYLWTDIKASLKIAFFICIGSAAIHYFFFDILTIVLLSFGILVYTIVSHKKIKFLLYQYVRRHFILWLTTLFFCAYWIIPYFAAMFYTDIEPNNTNVIDTLSMLSRYSNFKNIVYLVSYWWPMFNTSQYLDTMFWIGGGIFLFFICYIVLYRFKNHFYITLFSLAAIFSVLLATGVNTNILDKINILVVTQLPVFGQIFRDPNKLVGPMAAYFAILIGFAVDRYLFLLEKNGYKIFVKTLFIIILLTAHYFYYRPFNLIFTNMFYSGAQVPAEYTNVNHNHNSKDGKILWNPNMEDMLLSNKMSNYTWNVSGSGLENRFNLMKSAGNFHLYSSSKPIIFQHENNDGAVTYLYSFIQNLIDRTGGQHLDDLISWLGFNEFGFHRDVAGQEERQKFNYAVLNAQKGLTSFYKDNIFTLYNVLNPQPENFTINKTAYLTKGLYSLLYMFDNKKQLNISSTDTGILWSQLKTQDYKINNQDLMIGDNKLDFVMPQIDKKYILYPFDYVNTANPDTGWAKTKLKDYEWEWMLRTKGINDHFEYDYSHGVAYTNVSHRLTIPSYKLINVATKTLISTKDILNDFFTPDDPSMFNLTVFPDQSKSEGGLQGVISKGLPGNNVWQVASSKLMDVTSLQGSFIRLHSVVSGISAGSLNFKVFFYDSQGKEIGVSYLSKPDNMTEFMDSDIFSDAYVPADAQTMKISILSMQDTIKKTYFWIHKFEIYSVGSYQAPNSLRLPVKEVSETSEYRVFVRAFSSDNSTPIKLSSDADSLELNFKGSSNSLKWIDAGVIKINGKYLDVMPNDGFTAINEVVIIPKEKCDNVMNEVLKKLNGYQIDCSLADQDYQLESQIPIRGLQNLREFPNTINGSFTLLNSGKIYKDIDILKEGNYHFSMTGNVTSGSSVIASITNQNNEMTTLNLIDNGITVERNFDNQHYSVNYKENKYYLSIFDNTTSKWQIKKYNFEQVHLKPGKYKLEITVKANDQNLIKANSLHQLESNEVIIPPDFIDSSNELISIFAIGFEINKEQSKDGIIFRNTKTKSKTWIIYSENQVKVSKGDLIVFRSKVNTNGLIDVHSKLLWMDDQKLLKSVSYVPYDNSEGDYYLICESPIDGYVQPSFLSRSNGVEDGTFSAAKSDLHILDDFTKIEGTTLIPQMEKPNTEASQISKDSFGRISVSNSRYLINNEAYNSIWRYAGGSNSKPTAINFIHNAFVTNPKGDSGWILIEPVLRITYFVCLLVSAAAIFIGIFILNNNKKVKIATPPDSIYTRYGRRKRRFR